MPTPRSNGPTSPASPVRPPLAPRSAHRLLTIGILAALLFGAVGTIGGGRPVRAHGETATVPAPGPDSVDAAFLRDMIVHHEQAVAMAFLMRDRSTDNLLDAIATDIIYNQLVQIGMMRGYLDAWDLPLASDDPPMAWMGHPMAEGERMPGMASPEELIALRDLPLADGEILFFRLMIRHHVSGVQMAQAGLALADTRPARDLATVIIPLQGYEIELMQVELLARSQPLEPVPDLTATPAAPADAHADHDDHAMPATPEPAHDH